MRLKRKRKRILKILNIHNMERCPSGLRSTTGNRVSAVRRNAGSNPALSAEDLKSTKEKENNVL